MSDPIIINITTGDLLPLLGASLPSGVTGSLSLSLNLTVEVPEPPPADTTDAMGIKRYLLSTFKTDDEKPYILHSDDGITFTELLPSTYSWWSTRDPKYRWSAELNKHLLAHTNGGMGASGSFTVAQASPTLTGPLAWTSLATPACSLYALPDLNKVWAPSWFEDPSDASLHCVVAIQDNDSGPPYAHPFYPHETHPTNAAMTEWSAPVRITGTAIPESAIDIFIFKHDQTYYMIGNNQSTRLSFIVSSNSPFSGYDTLVRDGDFLGAGTAEGCMALKVGTKWRFYFDKYILASPIVFEGMHYVESSSLDLATCTFTTPLPLVTPFIARHGGIVDRLAA